MPFINTLNSMYIANMRYIDKGFEKMSFFIFPTMRMQQNINNIVGKRPAPSTAWAKRWIGTLQMTYMRMKAINFSNMPNRYAFKFKLFI